MAITIKEDLVDRYIGYLSRHVSHSDDNNLLVLMLFERKYYMFYNEHIGANANELPVRFLYDGVWKRNCNKMQRGHKEDHRHNTYYYVAISASDIYYNLQKLQQYNVVLVDELCNVIDTYEQVAGKPNVIVKHVHAFLNKILSYDRGCFEDEYADLEYNNHNDSYMTHIKRIIDRTYGVANESDNENESDNASGNGNVDNTRDNIESNRRCNCEKTDDRCECEYIQNDKYIGGCPYVYTASNIECSTDDAVHDVMSDAAHDVIGDVAYDVINDTTRDAVHDVINDTTHDAVHDVINDTTHDAVHDVINVATHDAVHDVINVVTHDATHDVVHDTTHVVTPDDNIQPTCADYIIIDDEKDIDGRRGNTTIDRDAYFNRFFKDDDCAPNYQQYL